MAKILVVDDEPSILETLDMFLSEAGHHVIRAYSGSQGLLLFENHKPDIVILDIRLPDSNGLDILSEMRHKNSRAKIIMITAYHDMETTIEAMKRGGFDYIHKPLDVDEIESAVGRAINLIKADTESSLSSEKSTCPEKDIIVGKSPKMRDIFKTIGLICQNRVNVLIHGETGTGKELIARIIHKKGINSREPFIILDCSATVDTLLETELFGHEKGAFTGAVSTKKGKIELAGNGTLFLDEVGELPLPMQKKLLGFLQRREYMRVGGQNVLKSGCRIIAATHRDLSDMVSKGLFREDLYYRLKVVSIHVPPLRERKEDIPELVDHFLRHINHELGTSVYGLQPGVIEILKSYSWPGNVRELENFLVEAVVRARGNVILIDDVKNILTREETESTKYNGDEESLKNIEKEHIANVLLEVNWNRTEAAKRLGISLPTLRAKIRKYRLDRQMTRKLTTG